MFDVDSAADLVCMFGNSCKWLEKHNSKPTRMVPCSHRHLPLAVELMNKKST